MFDHDPKTIKDGCFDDQFKKLSTLEVPFYLFTALTSSLTYHSLFLYYQSKMKFVSIALIAGASIAAASPAGHAE